MTGWWLRLFFNGRSRGLSEALLWFAERTELLHAGVTHDIPCVCPLDMGTGGFTNRLAEALTLQMSQSFVTADDRRYNRRRCHMCSNTCYSGRFGAWRCQLQLRTSSKVTSKSESRTLTCTEIISQEASVFTCPRARFCAKSIFHEVRLTLKHGKNGVLSRINPMNLMLA